MFSYVITLLCLSVITLSQAQNSNDIAEQLADGKISSRGGFNRIIQAANSNTPVGDIPIAEIRQTAQNSQARWTISPKLFHGNWGRDNVHFSSSGKYFTYSSNDGYVNVARNRDNQIVGGFYIADVSTAVLLDAEKLLMAADTQGNLSFYSTDSRELIYKKHLSERALTNIKLSTNGQYVAVSDAEKVFVWSLQTGKLQHVFAHENRLIAFADNDRKLVACSIRVNCQSYDLQSGAAVNHFGEENDNVHVIVGLYGELVFYYALDDTSGVSYVASVNLGNREKHQFDPKLFTVIAANYDAKKHYLYLLGGEERPRQELIPVLITYDLKQHKILRRDDYLPLNTNGYTFEMLNEDTAEISPDGRFLVIRSNTSFNTYHIDLSSYQMTPYQQTGTVEWIDFNKAQTLEKIALLDIGEVAVANSASGPLSVSKNLTVVDLKSGVLQKVIALPKVFEAMSKHMVSRGDSVYLGNYAVGDSGNSRVYYRYDFLSDKLERIAPDAFPEPSDDNPKPPKQIADFLQKYHYKTHYTDFYVVVGGNKLIFLDKNRTLEIRSFQTNELLVRLLQTTDGDWLIYTPEGFFNASKNGGRLLSINRGLETYSIDGAYAKLYRPDLVAAKLNGDPNGEVASAAAALHFAALVSATPADSKISGLPIIKR